MEPAAYADAALINRFPSFSLPPPPVPKPGAPQPRLGGWDRSPGGAAGGCFTAGVGVPVHDSPGAGGGGTGAAPPDGTPSFPGAEHPPPRGRPRLLPPQPPQTTSTHPGTAPPPPPPPRPGGAPDTRYLLTRGPEAAQPRY